MSYPRIIIYGQAFNKSGGGAITLSNLFSGWDRDKIAVICLSNCIQNPDLEICNTYYQIGEDERKWHFPFSLIQRKSQSGILKFDGRNADINAHITRNIRKKIVDNFFFPVIGFLGLFHCSSNMEISERLCNWLTIYKPDVMYVQISTREEIKFVSQMKSFLKIPLIIHMMDDWPSVISDSGIFKKYWHNKINSELKELITNSDLLMTISEEMTIDYKVRYNKSSVIFHNPIDINVWKPFQKSDYSIIHIPTILYAGRVGTATRKSITFLSRVIDSINKVGIRIKLDIMTSDMHLGRNKFKNFKGVSIKEPVPFSNMPTILSQYDLLLLPIDFDRAGFKFARLSMPTKVPEYMISGTPVLVFADKRTAISQHAVKYGWAYVINEYSEKAISAGLNELFSNETLRVEISSKARDYAVKNDDAELVRERFRKCFVFDKKM